MSELRRAFAAAVIVLAACLDDTTAPVAGTLKVNFTTPNGGQDGAVLLLLTAPAVPLSAAAAARLTLWGEPITTTTVKLVVTGTLSTGTILTLRVDDVNKVSQYTVSLQSVAADSLGGYAVRTSLTGYSATITK